MARGGWLSLLLTVVFSVLLTLCCGQFQQIDLTSPNTRCNMSSLYTGREGTSLDCHGAINGNIGTTWIPKENPGANCLYTDRYDRSPSWQVDLEQPSNIHRIIIYSDVVGKNYMQLVEVTVDGRHIYTFCNDISCIDIPHIITGNLPVRGQLVELTRRDIYLPMCELQVEGCARDMYGTNCTQVCSPHCTDDGVTTTCDSITGNCRACQSGWWGDRCEKVCSTLCDGSCERDNGDRCLSCKGHFVPPLCTGCRPGFHGTECEAPCGNGCINKTCNRQNGACSCEFLWAPPTCTGCQDGYYGTVWCRPCGHCSNNTVCDNNNGHCPDGCDDGYGGDLCDVVSSGSSDTQDTVGPVVGSVVGTGVLIAVSVLIAAIIIRKRRSRDAPSPDESSEQRTEVQISHEEPRPVVDTEGNKPETSDPESNYSHLENYETPEDIRPYSVLQQGGSHPTNVNTLGDNEAVVCHDTTDDKVYENVEKQ